MDKVKVHKKLSYHSEKKYNHTTQHTISVYTTTPRKARGIYWYRPTKNRVINFQYLKFKYQVLANTADHPLFLLHVIYFYPFL